MARLRYLSKDNLAIEDRDLDRPNNNLYRVLANSPKCCRIAQAMAQFVFRETKLDGRVKELSILTIAYLTRSAYMWSHHIVIARDVGIGDDDLRQLVDYLEGRDRRLEGRLSIVVDSARDMTQGLSISDKNFSTLRVFFDDEEIVDLVTIVAHYNGVARLLATLEVDVEEDFLQALNRFPLPA